MIYVNLAIGILWFGAALYVAIFQGVAAAFAFCYLPALMFTRAVKGYPLNGGWPDLNPENVTVLAIAAGAILRFGQNLKIRWSLLDTIVLIAPVFTIISAISTENYHTGYNELLKQFCGWWVPYFVARFSFRSEVFRRQFLWVLVGSVFVLTPFVLIELRLWPHFYAQFLERAGIAILSDWRAEMRMGLFRTGASFAHPIFFGDACVAMMGLMLLLASTTSVGVKNKWVRLALGAAVFNLWASLSYGPYATFFVAVFLFFALRKYPLTRSLLAPGVLLILCAGFFVTMQLATTPLPERPRDGGMADSFWVRRLILNHSWELATTGGPFGHGRIIDAAELDLDSVDNAYILFAMCRGWLYLSVWLAIPAVVAWRVTRAMKSYRLSEAHIFPLAVGAATSLAISAAFYWVWAGWAGEPYTMLWLTMLAFTMSACDLCFEAAAAPAQAQARPAPRAVGFLPPRSRVPRPSAASPRSRPATEALR